MEGNAKISDFNIMKRLDTTAFAKTQKGTPYFMAPEVALKERYTEKCDIYSLCATFYEIIKEKIPYDDETITNPIQLIMRKNDPNNYEPIKNEEFGIKEIIDIINFNLCNSEDHRMSAKEICDKLDELELESLPDSWSESIVNLETKTTPVSQMEESHLMLGKNEIVNSSVFIPTEGAQEQNQAEEQVGEGQGQMGGGMMMMSSMLDGGSFNPSDMFMGTIRLNDLKETESVVFHGEDSPDEFGKSVSKIEEVPDDCDYDDDFEDG